LCGELSKGYRQRVGIAQAILHKPAVIILDEPTNGLDPTQIVEVRALIRSLRSNHTVILSTHILREVAEVCTSFAVLARGAVVDQGSLGGVGSEGEGWSREKELEGRFLTAVSEGVGEGDAKKESARQSLVVGVE
jgi:ABC-2 type transport system ATP-binding protein